MQKVLRDHDVDKHGNYDHGGNGEEEDEPNDYSVYYSDDDYNDNDNDPERDSKVAEDSTYAIISGLSNIAHQQVQNVTGQPAPALNHDTVRLFLGSPMQGVLRDQYLQTKIILGQIRTTIKQVDFTTTHHQLKRLGFYIEDITKKVNEFEEQAMIIQVQLKQKYGGTVSQSKLNEVGIIIRLDLSLVKNEHQSLQALINSWQSVSKTFDS
jgi:hypothetical protein